MLYQIKDGTVSAGGQTILSHIDFYIKEKEKIAVVDRKSTRLNSSHIEESRMPSSA